jgi:hypothetical protein
VPDWQWARTRIWGCTATTDRDCRKILQRILVKKLAKLLYYSDPSGTLIRCPRALIRVEATLQRQSDLPKSQRDNSLSDCSQLYVRLHAHACVVYRESFLESQRRVVAFRAPGAQPALSWPGHTLSLRTMKLALLTSLLLSVQR